MRRVIVSEFVSLDGVFNASGRETGLRGRRGIVSAAARRADETFAQPHVTDALEDHEPDA